MPALGEAIEKLRRRGRRDREVSRDLMGRHPLTPLLSHDQHAQRRQIGSVHVHVAAQHAVHAVHRIAEGAHGDERVAHELVAVGRRDPSVCHAGHPLTER
jgi:hypothetical protein